MFKLLAVFSALCAVASAGYLGGVGLGYHGYTAPGIGYHAPVIAAAPVIKTIAAPVVHAPIVKAIATPVATSYANTYKVATKSVPVVHAAPALVHAAPAIVHAAPALHTTSTYHGLGYGLHGGYGGYGGYGLHGGYGGYGLHSGLGLGYGHSLYH